MSYRALFAVGQEGSFAYLLPLWKHWLSSTESPDWRLSLDGATRGRRSRDEVSQLRCLSCGVVETGTMLADALDGWHPDVVIASASGAPVERAACDYARVRRLPVIRFIDTWYRYRDRLLFAGQPLELPNKILVIDEYAMTQAEVEGLPADLILAVGHPAWEAVQPLPSTDARDVMFVSQPVRRTFGSSLGYTEYDAWALFLDVARQHPDRVRCIFFAPHPADEMPPPVTDDLVTVVNSGHKAIASAGTVVGMFSSLLVDAVLANRHVISVQPAPTGPDMNAWGRPKPIVPRATDRASLIASLRSAPTGASELRSALKYSRARLEKAIESVLR
ncbi:MAG: hypothetical protein RO009_22335 [Pseudorhodoplanes sp.]|jgi:hypothetical protein|nr:hypothetical protein [Pseudorhodoplanes sp.]